MEQSSANPAMMERSKAPAHRRLDAADRVTDSAAIVNPAGDSADSSLIALARLGDCDAFCELCGRYEARVLRQAMALCGDAVAAEELAQDTLLAAWRSLGRFHAECGFFTWLCSILIHQYKSWTRNRARSARRHASPHETGGQDPLHGLPDGAETPAEALAASERAVFLRRCLGQLPDKHREVMFLRFYAQESLEGIAKVLGCSVGTVKSRLFHALDKLRGMRNLTGHDHPLDSRL